MPTWLNGQGPGSLVGHTWLESQLSHLGAAENGGEFLSPTDPGSFVGDTQPARSSSGASVETNNTMHVKGLVTSRRLGQTAVTPVSGVASSLAGAGTRWEGMHSHVDQMTTLGDYRLCCVCFKQPLNTCPLGCNRNESEGSGKEVWRPDTPKDKAAPGQVSPRRFPGRGNQPGMWRPVGGAVLLDPESKEGVRSWLVL